MKYRIITTKARTTTNDRTKTIVQKMGLARLFDDDDESVVPEIIGAVADWNRDSVSVVAVGTMSLKIGR
jgi:hypothetical protein